MSNTGYAALDHVGAITLAQSIKDMALGAGEFLVTDSDTVEGKAATGNSIQCSKRFIKKQKLWTQHQCARQGNTLPHAA